MQYFATNQKPETNNLSSLFLKQFREDVKQINFGPWQGQLM